LMLIRILSSDWPISIQVPSKLKKNRMHFYSIQVRSSFLIQVKKLHTVKLGIHDASFASKSPFKFLEFKFFDRVYHTRNLNQSFH
jgi:hypothetical protein